MLTLGAIATATAPAATLMIVRQYKARGIVTDTLLPVVAFDDAIGLIIFAISLAVAKRFFSNEEQEYVFGKQSYRMARCRDDVDVIITDSPLILSIIYNHNEALDESFEKVVYNIYNTYNNYDYLINRVKPYNPKGRNETEEESNKIMPKIEDLLIKHNINYELINGDDSGYNYVVRKIKETLNEGK